VSIANSTIDRRKELRRGKGPKRGKRIRERNPERRRRESARANGGDRAAWVRALPCILAGRHVCEGPVENAHVKGGGGSRKADARFIVPACHGAHRGPKGMHDGIKSFAARWGLDLLALAADVERRWRLEEARRRG
jgi:hypothetical protein